MLQIWLFISGGKRHGVNEDSMICLLLRVVFPTSPDEMTHRMDDYKAVQRKTKKDKEKEEQMSLNCKLYRN